MKVNLFVHGLGQDVDTIKLLELFTLYGTVDAVNLPVDKQTGKPLGYGFVEMTDRAGAERAIEAIHDKDFNGRRLSVRIADKKEKKATGRLGDSRTNGNAASAPGNKRPRKISSFGKG